MPSGGIEVKYVGLDVHKEYIQGTVLDEHGKVVKLGRFDYIRGVRRVLPRNW